MMIREKNIFFNLEGKNKYEILEKIIYLSSIKEEIKEFAYRKVKEREELQSTAVGHGIGVAHAKMDIFEGVEVLMSIHENGVDYESYDGEDAKIIFVILASKDENTDYLKVLSKISRICRKNEIIEKIIKEKNKKEIIELFI